MIDNNREIRRKMKEKHITQWMLADYFGVHETTVIRQMRHELSETDKQKYLAAIDEIVRWMEDDGK